MISPGDFFDAMQGGQGAPSFALATVIPGYAGGRPQLIFDGETVATTRTYPVLDAYTPHAGDRVLVALHNGGGVILHSFGTLT